MRTTFEITADVLLATRGLARRVGPTLASDAVSIVGHIIAHPSMQQ